MHGRFDKDGKDTVDHIYLLSEREVYKYFRYNEERRCGATRYAISKMFPNSGRDGKFDWWLRSPGISAQEAVIVGADGCIYTKGLDVNIHCGIRPALWVALANLKS